MNDTPVLSLVGDHSTDEDNDLTISVSSDDIDLTYFGEQHTFTLVCGDDSLVSTGCVSTGDRTADCTFDVQDDQYGSTDCTVTVDDGNGASDSEDITLTVNSVNDTPVLALVGDQTTDEDNDLTISVSSSEPDLTSVSYTHLTLPTIYSV